MERGLRGLASLAAWFSVVLAVACAAGCGSSVAAGEGAAGAAGAASGAACAPLNATQPCSCAGDLGRQVCTATGWDACRCAETVQSMAGAAGTAGAAGQGAVGGSLEPSPDGNSRADLVFDWERSAGPTGPCEPGVYAGSYACDYVAPQFPPPGLHVEGLVNLTLVEGDSAEVLVISDGTLAGNAFLFIGFTSELAGQLTCANDQFEATAVNGAISIGGTFHGELEGELDRATQTLMGTWALTVDGAMPGMDMGTCAGAWTAVRQP
jgi:hypothetical protein